MGSSYGASNGVDDDLNTLTFTDYQTVGWPYWGADLGSSFTLDRVVINGNGALGTCCHHIIIQCAVSYVNMNTEVPS